MTHGPTMLEKANAAWDGSPPDWVVELAQMATVGSLNSIAEKLGCSASALSQTLHNKYRGDVAKIEELVRGALMGKLVVCPILGEIGRHDCLKWQAKDRAVTNAIRTQVYRACRAGCPHSRLKGNTNVER